MPEIVLAPELLHHPLQLSDNTQSTLSAFAGQRLVLYFYPKDNTPGCTTEGRDFSALHPQFVALDTAILGVSRDSVASHTKFSCAQGFAFPLVSDTDTVLCRAFDVLKPKLMYGRSAVGIVRSTFVLDRDQTVLQSWRNVKVSGHAQEILTYLQTRAQK